MLKKLFGSTKKKSDEELRHEQYVASLNSVTHHYNGVKINETLVGKINGTRMNEIIHLEDEIKPIQSVTSIPRPKYYGTDMFAWLQDIRKEAKESMNTVHKYELQDKENAEKQKQARQEKALKERREFFVNYGLLTE